MHHTTATKFMATKIWKILGLKALDPETRKTGGKAA